MDLAIPRGGLERVFAQYDTILSHHPPMHPSEPEPLPSNPPVDTPPWEPSTMETHPQAKSVPDMPSAPPPTPTDYEPPWWTPTEDLDSEARLKQNLGYDPTKSWKDIDAQRAAEGERKMMEHFKNPGGASFEQDENGLTNAYADKTATGVYYDPSSRTEYVKGSATARDWWDDFTKIPFWGDIHNSERYQQADDAYNKLIMSGKPVDRVVGHSLGGSVALQMQQDHDIPQSRTFGAPVLDLKPFDRFTNKAERYRHPLDPVSILDRGAKWGKLKGYSHSYTGYESMG